MQHANRGGGRTFIVNQSHRNASNANDGSESKPWLTIQHAADLARPGDTILVKAGVYAPFKINTSGTPEARIIFAAHPGDEHRAIIDGSGAAVRGLIETRGQSHITIEGFRIQNAHTDGIFIEGSKSGARDIQIIGNQVDTTGNSGIYAAGLIMGQTIGVNEYRLFDVLIHSNEVTNTNTPSGQNEAITVGGGINGFVVSHNWVHHSDQYGIDAKLGAINGRIHDNLIHHIEKHAIYLDSAVRTVANIEIINNTLHNNNNGIALARESNRTPKAPNISNIEVRDNLIHDNDKYGVMLYKHIWDVGTGLFHNVKIHSNSIVKNGSDGVHLVGIGGYATKISITDNTLFGNGRDINNRIGATEWGNTTHLDPRRLDLDDGARAQPVPALEPKLEPIPEPVEEASEKRSLELIGSDPAPHCARRQAWRARPCHQHWLDFGLHGGRRHALCSRRHRREPDLLQPERYRRDERRRALLVGGLERRRVELRLRGRERLLCGRSPLRGDLVGRAARRRACL